jgi:transcriptional regulator with XRE-family HTH domain
VVATVRGRTSSSGPAAARETAASEVAEFLRARRSRLQPADVGLPASSRRRTPGLRREEVAQLADISTTYYTFLEQGRDIRPSLQVLTSLAGALRLTAAERAHLVELVHGVPGPDRGPERLAPQVAALVDRLDPWPAYVTGRCWDVLAANRACRALWTDWTSVAADERNMLWWTFMEPAARTVLVDWKAEARAQLARFRLAAAGHTGDAQFSALIDRLQAGSAEVRKWWPEHEVTQLSSGTKRIRHAELGIIAFRHVVLQVADDPEQKLVTFTATPADERRLARLIGADR